MNNDLPLQKNSPERVSLQPIASGVDFATAVALRRKATSTGATPAYLLAPEALLYARSAAPYAFCDNVEYRYPYRRGQDPGP